MLKTVRKGGFLYSFLDSSPLYLLGFYTFGLTGVRKSGIIIGQF